MIGVKGSLIFEELAFGLEIEGLLWDCGKEESD